MAENCDCIGNTKNEEYFSSNYKQNILNYAKLITHKWLHHNTYGNNYCR